MARSATTDPLLSHHFALLDVPVAGLSPTAFPLKTAQSAIDNGSFVGFSAIQMPEMTMGTREIAEGNWPFVHEIFDGRHTGGDMTLEFALFPTNFDMYFWFMQAVWGRIAPRRNFLLCHLDAGKLLPRRVLNLQNCIPKTWNATSDLDAKASEVLLETLVINVQRILPVPLPGL